MATWTFTCRWGVLVRGRNRDALKRYCLEQGLEVDIEQAGSAHFVQVRGPVRVVEQAQRDIMAWFE